MDAAQLQAATTLHLQQLAREVCHLASAHVIPYLIKSHMPTTAVLGSLQNVASAPLLTSAQTTANTDRVEPEGRGEEGGGVDASPSASPNMHPRRTSTTQHQLPAAAVALEQLIDDMVGMHRPSSSAPGQTPANSTEGGGPGPGAAQVPKSVQRRVHELRRRLDAVVSQHMDQQARVQGGGSSIAFEWKDSTLVSAIKEGHWVSEAPWAIPSLLFPSYPFPFNPIPSLSIPSLLFQSHPFVSCIRGP